MKHNKQITLPLTFFGEFNYDKQTIRAMDCVQAQQSLTNIMKHLAILCGLLLLWFFSDAVWASQTAESITKNDTPYSSLWLESEDGTQKYASEALSTDVSMIVSGPILRATVTQTFRNQSQVWLEGIYSFPLPEQAVVDQLNMVIGERIIKGHIKEKQAAKKTYEKARANGQRTSLLSQHRTNIFTTSVANIGPGEAIRIEFEYQQILDFRDHQYSLRFPMVTTPQYTPPRTASAQTSPEQSIAEPINFVRTPLDKPSNPVSIRVDLKPGFPSEPPSSISHQVSVNTLGDAHFTVDMNASAALSNRDFILSWKLKPFSKPMASILREDVADESYGFMMIMPPQGQMQAIPRELIWVLDVSGSMQGESIEQARSAILKALSRLKPEDHFNIIYFNTQAWQLFPNSRSGTVDNLNFAREKILKLEANGGTEMRQALTMALNERNQSERLRQIIFVTDGAVSNEAELFSVIESNLDDTRLFTVGIGSAPNSYFMRKAALAGRGSFTYISQPKEVSSKIDQLLRKLEAPALTDLGFDLNDHSASVLPHTLPDVYLGEPVYISFKADRFPQYAALSGLLNGTPSLLQLPLQSSQHKGVAVEWARRKVSELIDLHHKAGAQDKLHLQNEATNIALAHHQVSKFTSLVAVDETPQRAGGLLKSTHIPANTPKGWVNPLATPSPSTVSRQGIRLAQTATNTPYHLLLGGILLTFSILVWLLWFMAIRRNERAQTWHRG